MRFGSRDLTIEEAQADYLATQRRLQGADKTTAAYRTRAEQAMQAVTAYQQILRDAGMLSEDGTMLTRSPADIRAEMQRRAAGTPEPSPEPEFGPPDFFKVGDDAASTDAFYAHLESIAATRGVGVAFAMLTDHLNETFKGWHAKLTGEDGYLTRQMGARLAPIEPFFQQLNDVRAQGDFLADMATRIADGGALAYPELDGDNGNPDFVRRLISELDAAPKEWARSPKGFERIVQGLRWQMHQESLQAPPPADEFDEVQSAQSAQSANPPPAQAPAPRAAVPARRARPAIVSLDSASPSGVPRPRANGAVPVADDGSRLIERSKRGVLGGINWGI